MTNQILVIARYSLAEAGTWVFDEPPKEIYVKAEPKPGTSASRGREG